MTGQWLVLFCAALLPWFARSLLELVAKPSRLPHFQLLTAVAISMVSIHSIAPGLIVAVPVLALRLWQLRHQRSLQAGLLKYSVLSASVWLVINSYWLIPTLTCRSDTAVTVGRFASVDQAAFATLAALGIRAAAERPEPPGFLGRGQGCSLCRKTLSRVGPC